MSNVRPLISFQGGGIFFFWQMGVISTIKKWYNLDNVDFTGASAGALSATLAACQIDVLKSIEIAFQLLVKNNVWDRKLGLGGIWGSLVRKWLEEILPENCEQICANKLNIYILQLPSLSRRKWKFVRTPVNGFKNKNDLIECCLSSIHIPFFMNGKFSSKFRGFKTIDGSFLANHNSISLNGNQPTLYLDRLDDNVLKRKKISFLKLGQGSFKSKELIAELIKHGEMFAERLNFLPLRTKNEKDRD